MKEARPILKWAGGKWKLCPQYKQLGVIPKPTEYNRYFEPFLGGAAVFLYIEPEKAFLSDSNEDLINVYINVRDNLEELLELLKFHKQNHSKKYYYQIRREWREGSDNERAAKLIYLNKTCFNGLYRVNAKGEFNVPMGDYKRPSIVNEKNLRAFSKIIENTQLRIKDYRKAVSYAREGDFIYLDPPYQPLSETSSFTSYTKEGFGLEDQQKLREVFGKLVQRGCLVLESNSNAKEIHQLYEGFHLTPVMAPRFINAKGSGRKPIQELAITNFKPRHIRKTTLDQF